MTIQELYESLHDELLSWCQSMCGERAVAEDLVQEGFARAIMNSETVLSLHERQQRAWLYRTIKNMYISRMRHSVFETVREELLELTDVEDEFARTDVEQLLADLPDMERKLFEMRYFWGYNSTELGQLFQMPTGTVRAKLSAARKKLKKMLED